MQAWERVRALYQSENHDPTQSTHAWKIEKENIVGNKKKSRLGQQESIRQNSPVPHPQTQGHGETRRHGEGHIGYVVLDVPLRVGANECI